MSGHVQVLTLVGSLRSGSHNRQLAEAAVKHAPEGVEVTLYEGLAEVPFYNEDIDTDEQRPAAATRLRETAARADAFLLVTPEYNGTMPAVLKNAIDWLSRPFGAGALGLLRPRSPRLQPPGVLRADRQERVICSSVGPDRTRRGGVGCRS
jgi:NAD(P)H-dependent FMN reductase